MYLKNSLTVISFLCSINFVFSQTKPDPKWADKYYEQELKGIDLVRLIDEYSFKPFLLTNDLKKFKTVLLQLSPQAYQQINIDSWYLCSTKHDDYFELWNMYYTKISKSVWDEKCKGLMALMCIDGSAKPPKSGDR